MAAVDLELKGETGVSKMICYISCKSPIKVNHIIQNVSSGWAFRGEDEGFKSFSSGALSNPPSSLACLVFFRRNIGLLCGNNENGKAEGWQGLISYYPCIQHSVVTDLNLCSCLCL